MNFVDYIRGVVVFFGIVFIFMGLFFLQYWDARVMIGLIMLLMAPFLLIASFMKTSENKLEHHGAPF